MRQLVVLLLVVLTSAVWPAHAIGQPLTVRITGTVVDPSGAVVPGATISATSVGSGQLVSAVSGDGGAFAIDDLQPGRYIVRAELSGFAPWTGAVVVQADVLTTLEITLGLAPYGDNVVVTGSRVEETIKGSPVAMTVIDGGDIERGPSRNYADILRRVPGLNVAQLSARDINLSTRTATSRNARTTLVLLDGLTMVQDYFGMVLWDLVPVNPQELKQVEVVRGPGSAIWGANALTGVINLITKSPRELDRTSIRLAAGNRDVGEGSVTQTGINGRLAYKGSASFGTQGAWPRPTSLSDGTQLPEYVSEGTTQFKIDGRLDFDPAPERAWRFDAGYARSDGLLITGLGPYTADTLNQGYTRAMHRRGSLSTDVSFSVHKAHYAGLLAPDTVDISSQTLQAEASDSLVLGKRHLVVAGGVLRLSHFDVSIAPDVHSRQEAGLFAEDDIFIADWMRLRVGARVDWFSTFGLTASPRLGVVLTPTPNHALRVALNRSYLAPSLTENFLRFSSTTSIPLPTGNYDLPVQVLGNEQLNEETLNAIEVGYTGVLGRRLTVSASVYRNNTRGLINLTPVEFYTPSAPPPGWPLPPETLAVLPLPRIISPVNVGKVREKGVELSADVRLPSDVTFSGNYSWQADPIATEEDGSPFRFPLNVPPSSRVNVELSVLKERYFGSLAYVWAGRAFWADVLTYTSWTPAYGSLNASFGVPLPKNRGTIMLSGVNLTDATIQQHMFADILRRRVVAEVRLRR